jgi:hypothetical protein
MKASELVDFLGKGGQTCASAESTPTGGSRVVCLTTGATREIGTETIVTADAADQIVRVIMSQAAPVPAIEELFRQLGAAVIGAALDPDVAGEAREWIKKARLGESATIANATFRLAADDADAQRLILDVRVAE